MSERHIEGQSHVQQQHFRWSSQLGAGIQRYGPSLTYTILAICVVLFTTRFLTNGTSSRGRNREAGPRTVPKVPYWIPIFGHIFNFAWDSDAFLKDLRDRYTEGVFALKLFGTTHNIIYSPGLTSALLNQKASKADSEDVSKRVTYHVFGFPQKEAKQLDEAYDELKDCYKYLQTEPYLGELVSQTAHRLKENVTNLVTFASSPVDQMLWERTSNVQVYRSADGDDCVEASLLPLIRDFVAHTAAPTLIGSNFLAAFPGFFDDLWTVDRAFLLLATGLPRWIPIPSLTRAHIARKRILDNLQTFHQALEDQATGLDPGADWQDLEEVGSLIRARLPIYRNHSLSLRARAALEHSLLWAANANSNLLIFWLLNRLYASPSLLALIRAEIAPYIHAAQPAQNFLIPEPPRWVTFDIEKLCTKCPLLKSCYIECLRLDTSAVSLKIVKQDLLLQPHNIKTPNNSKADQQAYHIAAPSYAHAAHALHATDPTYFPEPETFKADRHISPPTSASPSQPRTAEMGSHRPYGGGNSMCKGRAFAYREVMMFTAAIVSVWDLEAVGHGDGREEEEGKWKLPQKRKGTGVFGANGDLRVRVRRRVLPREKQEG